MRAPEPPGRRPATSGRRPAGQQRLAPAGRLFRQRHPRAAAGHAEPGGRCCCRSPARAFPAPGRRAGPDRPPQQLRPDAADAAGRRDDRLSHRCAARTVARLPQTAERPKGRRRCAALALIAMLMAWLALPPPPSAWSTGCRRRSTATSAVKCSAGSTRAGCSPADCQRHGSKTPRLRLEPAGHRPAAASSPWEAQFRARPARRAQRLRPARRHHRHHRRLARPGGRAAPALLDTLCCELQQVQRRQGLCTLARQDSWPLLLDWSSRISAPPSRWLGLVLSRWLPLERAEHQGGGAGAAVKSRLCLRAGSPATPVPACRA